MGIDGTYHSQASALTDDSYGTPKNGKNGTKKKTKPSKKIKRNNSNKNGNAEPARELDVNDLLIQMDDEESAGIFNDSYSTFRSAESFN